MKDEIGRSTIIVAISLIGLLSIGYQYWADENRKGVDWSKVNIEPATVKNVIVDAQGGDKDSQKTLGKMYRDGMGVEQNYSKSIECFRQSSARREIAWMQARGKGGLKKGFWPLVEYYLGFAFIMSGIFLITVADIVGVAYAIIGGLAWFGVLLLGLGVLLALWPVYLLTKK